MVAKILVVDDDPAIAEMLSIVLEAEGFDTITVGDGLEAVEAATVQHPDLILLDVMLPTMNGIDVAKKIRETSDVPIVMLTAKTDTVDIVLGLESGADDYMIKPFKPKELIARVRTRLRHRLDSVPNHLTFGDIVIDVPGHNVTRRGETVSLTPLEFNLLVSLASHPGEVLSREYLLTNVWGQPNAKDARLINVHIQRLRGKIEDDPDDPQIIQTVRGIGYKID